MILTQSGRDISAAADVEDSAEQPESDAGSEAGSDAESAAQDDESNAEEAEADNTGNTNTATAAADVELALDAAATPLPPGECSPTSPSSPTKKTKGGAKKKVKPAGKGKKAAAKAQSPKPTLMQQYSAMFSLFDVHPPTEGETKTDSVVPFDNPMHSASAIKNRIKKLEDVSKGKAIPTIVAPASDPKNKYRFFGVFRLTTRNSFHNRPAGSPKAKSPKDATPVTPSTPAPLPSLQPTVDATIATDTTTSQPANPVATSITTGSPIASSPATETGNVAATGSS